MFRFSYLHLMPSFVPGCHVTFSRHILRLLLVVTVSPSVLVFDGLDRCEDSAAGMWRNVPDGEASDVLLTSSLGYGRFGERPQRESVTLMTSPGHLLPARMNPGCGVILRHPAEVAFVSFSSVKLPYFLPFCSAFWRLLCAAHTYEGGAGSVSLRAGYLHPSLPIMMRGRFAYSPAFIDRFSWTHGYLFYILGWIQYYFVLLLESFGLWPLGALSVGPGPLRAGSCFLDPRDAPDPSCMPCPSTSPFSKDPWSPFSESSVGN